MSNLTLNMCTIILSLTFATNAFANEEEEANFWADRLVKAVKENSLRRVKYYVEKKGVHPDTPGTLYIHNSEIPATALTLAARQGNTDIVAYLLANGANVDIRKKSSGETPLMRASYAATQEKQIDNAAATIKLLLAKGADINATDKHGYTALMRAAENPLCAYNKEDGTKPCHESKMLKFLLENGADVNKKNNKGITAIDMVENSYHWNQWETPNEDLRLLLKYKKKYKECADCRKQQAKGLRMLCPKGCRSSSSTSTAQGQAAHCGARYDDQGCRVVRKQCVDDVWSCESWKKEIQQKCQKAEDLPQRCKTEDTVRVQQQGQTHSHHRCPKCNHICYPGDSAHSAPSSRSAQGARRAQ